MKTRWGIPKFIDLKTFNDQSNGYLVNGTCTFGAEVFVVKNTFKGECLSAIDEPIPCMHTFKINSFSSMTLERYDSDLFVGGDYKWYFFFFFFHSDMNRPCLCIYKDFLLKGILRQGKYH